jgi:hypothetical protein
MQQMVIPNQPQMLPPSYAAAGAAGSGFPILDVASATAPADASNEAPPATAGDPVRHSCATTPNSIFVTSRQGSTTICHLRLKTSLLICRTHQ